MDFAELRRRKQHATEHAHFMLGELSAKLPLPDVQNSRIVNGHERTVAATLLGAALISGAIYDVGLALLSRFGKVGFDTGIDV